MYIKIQLPSNARMMPSKNFKISDDYEEKFSFQKKKHEILFKNSKRENIVWKAKLFRSDNFITILLNILNRALISKRYLNLHKNIHPSKNKLRCIYCAKSFIYV